MSMEPVAQMMTIWLALVTVIVTPALIVYDEGSRYAASLALEPRVTEPSFPLQNQSLNEFAVAAGMSAGKRTLAMTAARTKAGGVPP
jgi:hypothetical protein